MYIKVLYFIIVCKILNTFSYCKYDKTILYWGSMEPSLAQEYGLLKAFFILSIPLAANVDFYGVTDQSNRALLFALLMLVDYFGPIRDTLQRPLVAIGIEKMKSNP